MKTINKLISYNLKKDKGSFISFGIIILFTAFMLNLGLVLAFQVNKAYDEKLENLKGANINFCISLAQEDEALVGDLKKMKGIKEIEVREGVFAEAVIVDFRDADFAMNTIFYNMDDERTLNKLEIKETDEGNSGENSKDNDREYNKERGKTDIYLPLYVSRFGQFETGSEIIYQIDGEDYKFHIEGVVEEMQYGNYGKGLMGAYLPDDIYEEFKKRKELNQIVEYSILTEENVNQEELMSSIKNMLCEKDITMLTSITSDAAKQTRTMVCNLLIIILIAFSFVILFVSIFLSKFRIQNSIEEEMINMGVLKAVGYTGNMIIGTMILPYILVSGVAIVAGVIMSYGVLPILSDVLALQAGFTFKISFDITALILNIVVLSGIVLIFTYRASKCIRKIQPINAMRGNGEAESRATSIKQNILIFFVSFALMILMAFAGTLFYNVIIKPENFMNTLSEEMPEVIIKPEAEYEDILTEKLEDDSRVTKVLRYMTETVEIKEGTITAFICEDYSKVTNDLCYEGRNPESEDEIALGSAYADKYELGDKLTVTNGEVTHVYDIVGFVQSVNMQGEICELTIEGYENIEIQQVRPDLYVYMQEDIETEAFVQEFEESNRQMINSLVNNDKMLKTSKDMYIGLATIIIAVIFVLSVLIVLFILYIVIKSLITKRKKEFGIYKAMGYSNWQLIVKITGNVMPPSVLAVICSAVTALFYMPMINNYIFGMIGAIKNSLEVSVIFLMIFAFMLVVVNFIISICLARPIRKISVYSLIRE